MPFPEMSATSSGGVRSRTICTLSKMVFAGSIKTSVSSAELIFAVFGRPVTRSRPLISSIPISDLGARQPMEIFSSSAVREPIRILCLRRIYLTIASSNSDPAVLMDSHSATPPRDTTAVSVVPPPISITRCPSGLLMSMPAPVAVATADSHRYTLRAPASITASITARSSTPVMLLGTQMRTRGLKRLKLVTLEI